MSFIFFQRSDAQIKQFHNAKMLYETYLQVLKSFNLSYRYKMVWQKHKDGYELLAKVSLDTGKREYLGRRDEKNEKVKEDFKASKVKMKEKLASLKNKVIKSAKLNKLEGIARAPKELVDIFLKINELGLDDKLIVIGTNALYAYEAKCGLVIEQEHLATRDIDLLNRKEKGISFIFKELMLSRNAIDFLHTIDKSFQKSDEVAYRFVNDDGVWVELINPVSKSVRQESYKDNLFSDVIPLAMDGMQWLENSRLFKEMIVAENGKCANITTVHPLEFAIYKQWLSQREDRDYQKHLRDQQQSRLITQLMQECMVDIDIEVEAKKIKHLRKEVVDDYLKKVLTEG